MNTSHIWLFVNLGITSNLTNRIISDLRSWCFLQCKYWPDHLGIRAELILSPGSLKVYRDLVQCFFVVNGLVLAVMLFQVAHCIFLEVNVMKRKKFKEHLVLYKSRLFCIDIFQKTFQLLFGFIRLEFEIYLWYFWFGDRNTASYLWHL